MLKFKFIPAILVLMLFGSYQTAYSEEEAKFWLPLSPSPAGEVGGLFVGEYEQRVIDEDDLTVRRILFRMGWSPSAYLSVWVEGGVASLAIDNGETRMQGDFGGTAGVGGILAWADKKVLQGTLFLCGRGSMLNSKLGHDQTIRGLENSRRSSYEWWEASVLLGVSYKSDKMTIYLGPTATTFALVEDRSTRTSGPSFYRETNIYQSGIEPGGIIAILAPLKNRFNARFAIEASQNSVAVTLSAGQWGIP